MTKFTFTVVVPASGFANNVNIAAAAFAAGKVPNGCANLFTPKYLPCAKLSVQVSVGSSGLGFIGGKFVDDTGLVDCSAQLNPGGAGQAGQLYSVESEKDRNVIELNQYYLHGTNTGDEILVSYHQG